MMILKAKVLGLLWKQDEFKCQQAKNKIQWNINEVLCLNDVRKSKNTRLALETKCSKMLNYEKLIMYVKWQH